ncbi:MULTISPECIES: PAS domain S-box protein [Rhodopseudomonas]|uniref:histidine kinase n=1 Tax=Rhodopseudomonas palustris TaxID=1076 RepID=A0A0D7E3T8_RHOPL|nr:MULTISPECIES: PAS domain S-box protein [Rhodopseudomonas]KIZ35110.1 histidine kinase [Rhodopseudomonas palustris]MDF3809130.1 PAS domain S-box protein [Rhodopseudomonas sp. BAL398]WOK19418.1 PAS domain S-box protein [Rhodopseudomonas sp. BAL398]
MPAAFAALRQRLKAKTLSIGQLTFGSFLLLLAIITLTSVGSVVAIRHIDNTFGELQRLQSVGDLAEEIERRMSDLRFAARQVVTDPGTQPGRVFEAASALSALLKKTRLELAPDQIDMIDGVTARLRNYRDGLARITALIPRRAELLAALPPLRDRFDASLAGLSDRSLADALYREQGRITAALLARDLAGAEQSARRLRDLPTGDPAAAATVRDYADAVGASAATEREIAELDKEVLGTEGRLIGRVTELLRDVAARCGRVLSRDLARTLAEDKWQSIVLGIAGVLVGLLAAGFVVRRTVGPLAKIATAIRALAAGEQHTAIPATEVRNEIGDIARAAEVFRRTLADADAAREAAVHALAEQRLAEESYRKLFEGSIDGIYVTTPAGALLNANPALARMMGYETPEDLIRQIGEISRSIYTDPDARAIYRVLMERDGMVREFEYQARKRNGDVLWLSDSATAVRDESGQVVRYEGAVRDITDQKRAEHAVAEGRRLLQQVIDTVPAVINVKDRDLRYVLMNRYMAGIFGIAPRDAIGQTTSELMARYGAWKTDENDKRVLAAGKDLGFYEEEYPDFAGVMRHWLVNKLPLRGADGEIERIVTVALDIGDRKRGELEMRKAKDAAEAALRNLKETQQSLIEAEKLAALGRLVAGVAHEVNNPVGIGLTVASALERKTAMFAAEVARGDLKRSSLTEFLASSRDAAAQLVANLNRAAELIQSFKQVAADRNYSDQRVFDLGDLTEQVVMSLRPGLRKQNLTLNVACQPGLMMNSYPGPYGQVLTNLFLNSVAHAFPGGGAGTVDIQVRESGKDNVEILYSDDGCGMSLDVRRRAFDPFFTTRRDQGGTGLGLHIVYSIVTNRLGGRLDLDSEPGGGTRIQIILPRIAPRDLAEPAPAAATG